MRQTPRVDAEAGEACFTESGCAADVVNADFARTIERELAACREALETLTCWSRNGHQLCFRTHNGIPMGMSKKQERLARAALDPKTHSEERER